MIKLQPLMELEKSNNGLAHPSQKKVVDFRPLVDLGDAETNLDIETEDGLWPSHSGVHFRRSFHSRLEESVPDAKDIHRLGPSLELEEPPDERSQCYCASDPQISDCKQAEDCFGEEQKSVDETDFCLSPMNGSTVLHWKSADGPVSVKVERCNGRDGEITNFLDVSPASGRSDFTDLPFRENPESPHDCRLAVDNSLAFKENAFDCRKSVGLTVGNCAQRSSVNGGPPMTLPSKWKKDTKAELRRMIQEQEMTWKIAEDAVEEIGRRLEVLERYKIEIQDTSRSLSGNIDRYFKLLQENFGDCPRGFNSLYNSPIYEERKSFYNSSILMEKKGGRATCQDVCTSSTRPDVSKDSEIEKLKIEVAQLRAKLQQWDIKRPDSPTLKSVFKFSPRSPPSPTLPTSRPLAADTDWSLQYGFVSGFETPLKNVGIPPLHLISQGNPTTPEVIREEMEPEFADDSFEEMKTITIHAIQNGSKQSSNGRVDRFDVFPSGTIELDVGDRGSVISFLSTEDCRGWVPIPDESRDDSAARMFVGNGICQIEETDYQERSAPQADKFLSVDMNSDEGELGVVKTAVRKFSRIFWEQEEKLKTFKNRDAEDAEDARDLCLDMLKEMSQKLGELCHELHDRTQSDEVLQIQKRKIRQCYPLRKVVQKFQHMEMMDTRAACAKDVESGQQLQIEYEDTNLVSTHKLKCGDKQSFKREEDQPENIMTGSKNLRTPFQAAKRKTEEKMSTNLLLAEKLQPGSQYLPKMQADHAHKVTRKDHSIIYEQQFNFDLTNEISQKETSLEDIRSCYKSLVSSLEQQFEDVKKEALSLQVTVYILKEEIRRKENLVSNLEAEAKEHELQIEQLRSQIEPIQTGTRENVREKLELLYSLEAMRKEMDEQQHRVTELISINEDLIAFSESKEDEITGLKVTIKRLQQCVDEKSAEAAKLSVETLAFSREVVETRRQGEAYRLRCTALKSQLEETEQALLAREASMERMTKHLGKTVDGQDFLFEEKEQLLVSLNRAQYKEHRLGDQVRQSKIIIQNLEEKLNSMDAEINEARLGMAEMKAKSLEAFLVEHQAGEMGNRAQESEKCRPDLDYFNF